eukprot:SAG11_NODE_142_length_14906_cov_8.352333_18_plen_78_part_00
MTSSSGRGAVPIERLEAAPNNSAIRGRYYSEQTFKRAAAAVRQLEPLVILLPLSLSRESCRCRVTRAWWANIFVQLA